MAFVGVSTASVASTVQDVTISVPAGSVGDRLVVFLLRNNATATWSELTTTAFTSVGTPATGMAGYWRVADGTEAASYTFRCATSTTGIAVGFIFRYSGVGDVAAVSFTNAAASATIALTSVNGTNGGTLVGAVARPVSGAATYLPPGTMTERHDAAAPTSNAVATLADETLAATGATGTRTFTQTGVTNHKGMLVAFAPAGTIPTGTASGTYTFAGSAVGKRTPKATGTGTFTFTGSATGKRTPKGTGSSGTFTFTGSATGTRTPKGTGTGTFTFGGSATGSRTPKGTGSGTYLLTGSAVGSRTPKATGTGSYAFAGTAVGIRAPKGSGAGSYAFTGAASGSTPRSGTATGTATWAGTATGHREAIGGASGTWAYVGSGTGFAVRLGAATGTLAWTGTAVGARAPKGAASGAFAFAGSALGVRIAVGQATGTTTWTGTAIYLGEPRDIAVTVTLAPRLSAALAATSRTAGVRAGRFTSRIEDSP